MIESCLRVIATSSLIHNIIKTYIQDDVVLIYSWFVYDNAMII